MRPRTIAAGAVVAVALLATAGIAGAFVVGSSAADGGQADTTQAPDSNTITVGSSGQVQATADRAVVRLGVVVTGENVETVRERLASNTSSMRSALVDSGIDRSQIRTSHYDISKNDEPRRPGAESEPAYRAVHGFVVTVNDTDAVGSVIETAVANGATEVDGVQFTLSPEKRERLRNQALQQAMESARSKADAIASESGLSISGIDRVTTQYSGSPGYVEFDAATASGGTSIDGGPVTVSASVTVVYDTS